MNITTIPNTIADSVSCARLRKDSNYVRVNLGERLTAHFHSDSEFTQLGITGYNGSEIYSFRFPTLNTPSILAYAITHPDSFVDACKAFLEWA